MLHKDASRFDALALLLEQVPMLPWIVLPPEAGAPRWARRLVVRYADDHLALFTRGEDVMRRYLLLGLGDAPTTGYAPVFQVEQASTTEGLKRHLLTCAALPEISVVWVVDSDMRTVHACETERRFVYRVGRTLPALGALSVR